MNSIFKTTIWLFLCGLMFVTSAKAQQNETGFLVIAPDRGFMGNQEIRDIHQSFSETYLSSLAFITPEETDRFLNEGIKKLTGEGVSELVVIPMFLSDHHPLYKLAKERLMNSNLTDLQVKFKETMSESYLTAEILADRISEVSVNPVEESLVVVATGASNLDEMDSIRADVERILHMNHGRFSFNSKSVVVFDDQGGRSEESQKRLSDILSTIRDEGLKPVVVTFDLTPKLDGMMAFGSWRALQRARYYASRKCRLVARQAG